MRLSSFQSRHGSLIRMWNIWDCLTTSHTLIWCHHCQLDIFTYGRVIDWSATNAASLSPLHWPSVVSHISHWRTFSNLSRTQVIFTHGSPAVCVIYGLSVCVFFILRGSTDDNTWKRLSKHVELSCKTMLILIIKSTQIHKPASHKYQKQ